MEKSKTIGITVRIPKETYKRLTDYKSKLRPYMSLNSLIVEAIIGQLRSTGGTSMN